MFFGDELDHIAWRFRFNTFAAGYFSRASVCVCVQLTSPVCLVCPPQPPRPTPATATAAVTMPPKAASRKRDARKAIVGDGAVGDRIATAATPSHGFDPHATASLMPLGPTDVFGSSTWPPRPREAASGAPTIPYHMAADPGSLIHSNSSCIFISY